MSLQLSFSAPCFLFGRDGSINKNEYKKGEKTFMIKCPKCSLKLPENDVTAQKEHMERNHPEVIINRLKGAGMHSEAEEFAKERGIST